MARVPKRASEPVPPETPAEAQVLSEHEGILVIVEQRLGQARSVSWQLLGQGRRLADKLGTKLMALVLGYRVEPVAREAIAYGADVAYLWDDPVLERYRTRPYSEAAVHVIRAEKPEIVLVGATYTGRDLAGAVATRLETGLTADCTLLDVEPPPTRLLQASRPAFSEKLMATILCKKRRPQMASARPGVFEALPPDPNRSGRVVRVGSTLREEDVAARVLDFIQDPDRVNLEDATVIVAGGRGVGGPQGFQLLRQLAQVLGGEVGASRPAVEAGWIDRAHQVGQTGQTVRPKLYIACGISGAVQHLVGMEGSQVIVAVNREPDAPIFRVADYRIVGDLHQVVPALIAEARRRLGPLDEGDAPGNQSAVRTSGASPVHGTREGVQDRG
ncbi:electron transfer flavoprotein subunit alpha/FixB family protein [Limnochorda pilosa]|uniref:Electron transfer flavoprotein subunit alpha n=1 Tax=Limnochorda pilosa TaxID=1555112 RepID=A0A0K2SL14_LIMPI|nr:electron transfer flavoprotein subunit alpha/FixB family protein [Limnochorda pilosa]BAS27790.1 electron transfer flavoprotein subunit alpha [Limnochorda pilosa]